jgi:hypothetical protein
LYKEKKVQDAEKKELIRTAIIQKIVDAIRATDNKKIAENVAQAEQFIMSQINKTKDAIVKTLI